jgi:hypothetical protein
MVRAEFAEYAHLMQLAREYRELVRHTEDAALDMDEQRVLLVERSVLHDQIIASFKRLHIPFVERHDVRQQALTIAARGSVQWKE